MLFAVFAQPAFLLGLLAMASPIIIHLLAKRRAAEIVFPAMRFLRLTADRTSRRRRLEEILLLLLRAAALGIAALALAQPVISGIGAGQQRAMAVILDNSLSMQQEALGRSAWEAAKETALRLFAAEVAGTSAATADKSATWAIWLPCLQADDDPLRLLQTRTAAEAKRAFSAAPATAGKGDLKRLVKGALSALAKHPASARELYILTDGQASEWEGIEEYLADVAPLPRFRIFLYIPEGCGGPTLSIERLAVKMRAALPGEEARLEAEVRNWSNRPAETAACFYLNNAMLSRQGVSVPAFGKTVVMCSATLDKTGWQSGRVQIDADGLCRDNRRIFVLEVPEAARILLVDGSVSLLARDRTSLYFEAALSAAPAMRVKRIAADALAAEDLAAYDAVFLVDIPAPAAEAAPLLRLFVKEGGTAVFVPGTTADRGSWNKIFGPGSDERDGLLPEALREAAPLGGEDGVALEAADISHPLLTPFAAAREQIRKAKVRQAYGLEASARRGVRVALAAAGAPILLSRAYGKGRAILWTTALKPSWTNIAAKPIFVPLVLSHVYWALQKPAAAGAIAGEPLLVAQPAQKSEVKGIIRLPDGAAQPCAGQASPEQPLFFPYTPEDGIYTIELQAPLPEKRLRAVNPAAGDSDLTRIDSRLLTSCLGRLGPTVVAESWERLAEEINRARQGTALMDPLLLLALCLLMAEGHYAAGLRRPEKKHV
ncbi:MAG: BatA and WFA domain-containing protein [Planctomycetota bacterium]|nr:BatA and WFA domain-containing protein [Planctomycetota bacterium]